MKGNEEMSRCYKAFAVATGNFDPFVRGTRKAVKYVMSLENMVGMHSQYPHGILWMFTDENSAKRARNKMEAKGIVCGDNICPCAVDEEYIDSKFISEMEEVNAEDYPYQTQHSFWQPTAFFNTRER